MKANAPSSGLEEPRGRPIGADTRPHGLAATRTSAGIRRAFPIAVDAAVHAAATPPHRKPRAPTHHRPVAAGRLCGSRSIHGFRTAARATLGSVRRMRLAQRGNVDDEIRTSHHPLHRRDRAACFNDIVAIPAIAYAVMRSVRRSSRYGAGHHAIPLPMRSGSVRFDRFDWIECDTMPCDATQHDAMGCTDVQPPSNPRRSRPTGMGRPDGMLRMPGAYRAHD